MSNIIRPVIDLDKLDKCVRDALTRFLGPCFVNEPEPSPPPTPSLDLLRRFAKVAGWPIYDGIPTIVAGPAGHQCPSESQAGKWLDSQDALDAAAVVAVRNGGGLSWRFSLGGGCMAYIFDKSAPHHSGIPPQAIASAGAAYAGRAGVRACLSAFEEKPA